MHQTLCISLSSTVWSQPYTDLASSRDIRSFTSSQAHRSVAAGHHNGTPPRSRTSQREVVKTVRPFLSKLHRGTLQRATQRRGQPSSLGLTSWWEAHRKRTSPLETSPAYRNIYYGGRASPWGKISCMVEHRSRLNGLKANDLKQALLGRPSPESFFANGIHRRGTSHHVAYCGAGVGKPPKPGEYLEKPRIAPDQLIISGNCIAVEQHLAAACASTREKRHLV